MTDANITLNATPPAYHADIKTADKSPFAIAGSALCHILLAGGLFFTLAREAHPPALPPAPKAIEISLTPLSAPGGEKSGPSQKAALKTKANPVEKPVENFKSGQHPAPKPVKIVKKAPSVVKKVIKKKPVKIVKKATPKPVKKAVIRKAKPVKKISAAKVFKPVPVQTPSPAAASAMQTTQVKASSAGAGSAKIARKNAATPKGSTGGGLSAAKKASLLRLYAGQVKQKAEREKRYPRSARLRNIEGAATVRVTVRKSGALAAAHLTKSSGSKTLDKACMQAVRRAAPFPPFPKELARNSLQINLPFRFGLR